MKCLRKAIWLLPLAFALLIFAHQTILLGRIPINADWLLHNFYPWSYQHIDVANSELDDPALNIFPLAHAAHVSLSEGEVPLWNPRIAAGLPLLADNTSFPFSVFRLLTLVFSFQVSYSLWPILQLVILGAGIFCLGRELGLRDKCAGLAALVCCLSETAVVWYEYQFWLGASCWLPWITFFFLRILNCRGSFPAICAAITIGASFLSGQLQIAVFSTAFSIILSLTVGKSAIQKRPKKNALLMVAALSLGLALAAVQIFPTWELVSEGDRGSHRYERVNYLRLGEILTYLIPDFFGNPGTGDYVGLNFIGSSYVGKHGGYVGFLTLFLAAVAWRDKRFKAVRPLGFAALGILIFLFLLRPQFTRPLSDAVHLIGQVHHKRLVFLVTICLGLLSGFGLMTLENKTAAQRRRYLVMGVWMLSAFLSAFAVMEISLLCLKSSSIIWPPILEHLANQQDRYGSLFLWPSVLIPSLSLLSGLLLLAPILQENTSKGKIFFLQTLINFIGHLKARLGRTRLSVICPTSLLCCVVAAELLFFGTRYNPFVNSRLLYPKTNTIDWLIRNAGRARICGIDTPGPSLTQSELKTSAKSLLDELGGFARDDLRKKWKGDFFPPNTAIPYGLFDVRGKESLLPSRYRRFFETQLEEGDLPLLVTTHTGTMDSAALDLLGAKFFVTLPSQKNIPPHFVLVYRDEVTAIYENTKAISRSYLVESKNILGVQRDSDVLKLLKDQQIDWGMTRAFVQENHLQNRPTIVPYSLNPKSQSKINIDKPHAIQVACETERGGLLVLGDTFYPGWRTYIDGMEVSSFPVNYLFRGIWFGPWKRSALWVYRPRSFLYGLWISLTSAGTCSLVFTCIAIRKQSGSK